MPLLLIDLDDTLVDRRGCFERWAQAFAEAHGLEDAVPWLVETDERGLAPRHLFFERAREHFGLADSVRDLVAAYHVDYPRRMQPPASEAVTLLDDLPAPGWKVGIVT